EAVDIVGAVAAGSAWVRWGSSRPRDSYHLKVCTPRPVSSAATEMPYMPRLRSGLTGISSPPLPSVGEFFFTYLPTVFHTCYKKSTTMIIDLSDGLRHRIFTTTARYLGGGNDVDANCPIP